jgi:phosphomannomutase
VLIGGEESGGISFKGNIPEGDGILIGLLLIEMVASLDTPLDQLVAELLEEVGPSHYKRLDLRLSRPFSKENMVQRLADAAPDSIADVTVTDIQTLDGVKYLLNDDSWLLIRPSGTEPVLRIYVEARDPTRVKALMNYGRSVADVKM